MAAHIPTTITPLARALGLLSGTVALSLLVSPGTAAARSAEPPRARGEAHTTIHVLPASAADLSPLLEQHTRSGGGGGGGGGHAVPRGGGGSGGGSSGGGTGGAVPRTGGSTPSGGGSSGGSGGATTRSGSGSGSGDTAGTPPYSRPRDGQTATGTAVRRQPGDVPPVTDGGGHYPVYYPWGWGGIGVGAYYGWYDPWGWGDPYGGGAAAYGYDYDGAIKLKVKPRQADVYVDGYYAGAVDDFDGTFQKLKLEPGPHRIEIRLEGYETLSFEVRILPDKTLTYKGQLQKRENAN